MEVLDFTKEQLIPFQKLIEERSSKYIYESVVSSFSQNEKVLFSKTKELPNEIASIKHFNNLKSIKDHILLGQIWPENIAFFEFFSKTNYCFGAHIHSKYSYVLTKEQLEDNYYYIDVTLEEDDEIGYWEKITKKIIDIELIERKRNAFFLKGNGYVIFNENYNQLLEEIDLIEREFFDNYQEDLYQKNSDALLIKEELDGAIITLKERQILQQQMLFYFDKVCRENDIKYSLTGGSLIGAVRHGGIIPWDDDIDVFLARPEYNKLTSVFNRDDSRYELINNQLDKNFLFPFSRLVDKKTYVPDNPLTLYRDRGLYVDVCVVDGLPKNIIKRIIHIKYMRMLFRLRRSTIVGRRNKLKQKHKFKYFIKRFINIFADTKYWNNRILLNMDKYSFEDAEYVANLTSQYGEKEILHKDGFNSYHDVKFGKYTFMVFDGYEEYLTGVYKDYLSLPSKKET